MSQEESPELEVLLLSTHQRLRTVEGRIGRLRIPALDVARGILMSLMALDHCRAVLYKENDTHETWKHFPTFHGNVPLFLTRLITHICAPGFFFLMGLSVVLFHDGRIARTDGTWSRTQVWKYFLKRGALLTLLSVTLFNFAWWFNLRGENGGDHVWVQLGVIYALGVGIVLGTTVFVLMEAIMRPMDRDGNGVGGWVVWTVFVEMILGIFILVEALTPDPNVPEAKVGVLARLTITPAGKGSWLGVTYPFVPWLPFALYGVVFGVWNRGVVPGGMVRRHVLAGLLLLGAFLAIRLNAGWGNINVPDHISELGGASKRLPLRTSPFLTSFIAFFNVNKYPPSLAYGTLTMGANHLLLAGLFALPWKEGGSPLRMWMGPLIDFGQSSLFFFGVHHLAYIPSPYIVKWSGWSGGGESLWQVYLLWLVGLAILWPVCRGYGRWKGRKPEGSLWRFF